MTVEEIEKSEVLFHASELIRHNAEELREAFSNADGTIFSLDKDMECQIDDLDSTSNMLLWLIDNYEFKGKTSK